MNERKAIEELIEKAEQGDAVAQCHLGELYFDGEEIEQDYAKALEYFEKAAEQKNANAQNYLGEMYLLGFGVEQDFNKAISLFQSAADVGFLPSILNLAEYYENGNETEKDIKRACEYYSLSLSPEYINDLDIDLQNEIINKLKHYGEMNNPVVLYSLAKECISLTDYEKSDTKKYIQLLTKAAEGGFSKAQYDLGKLYESGHLVVKNMDKAIELLEQAAAQGEKAAIYSLQYMKDPDFFQTKYKMKKDAEQLFNKGCELANSNNFVDAIPFFEQAAELENDNAIASLARIYIDGMNGIKPDFEKGSKYLERSVNNGNALSINYLGTLYLEGRCVPQDYEQAYISFSIAAEKGSPDALLNLAECYELGQGTDKNIDKAINCYFELLTGNYENEIKAIALEEFKRFRDIPEVEFYIDNIFENETLTPLMKAAFDNSVELAEQLIKNGAQLEDKDKNNHTALMYAIFNNSIDVAKLLIDTGANIETRRVDGLTPLILAAECNTVEIAELLISHGANIEAKSYGGCNPLGSAAACNSVDMINLLIHAGADINAKGSADNPPIGWASLENSLEALKLLIASGADIERKNSLGYTPLYLAVNGHSLESFEYLIEKGADINARNDLQETILMNAVGEDFIEGVKILLDQNVDTIAKNDEGQTAYDIAIKYDKKGILKLLLSSRD